MRFKTLLLTAWLFAIPTAAALDAVTFEVPHLYVGVEGYTVDVGQGTEGMSTPVRPEGTVTVKDVEAETGGGRCTIDLKGHATRACDPGEVRTTAPTDLVEADVDLIFPASAEAPAEEEATATVQDATVVDLPPARAVLIAAAAASVSMAALYAVWRVLKWTGLAALLPLYTHISDDEILDDANRASIYRLIQQEAGISTKDIADRLGLAWGTVTHHLGKLEKRRFVVSKKYGKYRRYFANGEGGTEKKDAVAVLRLDRTGDVAALIKAQPGMTQKAVSQALGVSSSTILWHVKRLEDVQLVRKVRDGKLVRYYPADGLDAPGFTLPTITAA